MNRTPSRRQFLGSLGGGIGSLALGAALADRLGLANAFGFASEPRRERLRFGALDPLVDLMQGTEPDALLPLLVQKLRSGTTLAELVGAGALANARAFGGTDYNGYHALMAMAPAFEMAAQMPEPYAALPVLKVLHRNARFVRDVGRSDKDGLAPVADGAADERLVAHMRKHELDEAERSLTTVAARSKTEAYEQLQEVVRDEMNVHRVVLAWRVHDLQRITGEEHAVTLMRQSVRFCIDEDGARVRRHQPAQPIGALLPKLLEEHHLDRPERGRFFGEAAWIQEFAETVFNADSATAAEATAVALAQSSDPEEIGAAISLAAARLLVHDPGRKDDAPGKPMGSVHGASVGVHASDSANAWRHLARVGSRRNACASLIAAAYHTAGQSRHVGALPFDHDGEPCTLSDPAPLRKEIEGRVREGDQKGACLAVRRYGELGLPADDLFALLLGFAVSADGALHAEKHFRTVQEEHATAQPAHRTLHLVALARAVASSAKFPAPGVEEARKLLSA